MTYPWEMAPQKVIVNATDPAVTSGNRPYPISWFTGFVSRQRSGQHPGWYSQSELQQVL